MLFSNNILFSLISNQPKRLAFIERKPQKTIILDENIVWYIQKTDEDPFSLKCQLRSHNLLLENGKIRIAYVYPSFLPRFGHGKNIESSLKISIKRFQKYLKYKKWNMIKNFLYKESILIDDVLLIIEKFLLD